MFLLFGLRGGKHGRLYIAARVTLVVAFLIAIFVFHPHGTTLDILQAVRVVLFVALIGSAWMARRRRSRAPAEQAD